MVVRALWRSEALRVVPWLRPCTVSDQGTTLRASDLHNARATILNPFNNDAIMGAIASQITSLTIAYSTVYSDADKKTSKLRVIGLCAGNSPKTGEFPAQMANNAEYVSICWRHHGIEQCRLPCDIVSFSGLCNIGYLSKTHLQLKSRGISFVNGISLSFPIIVVFCTEHDNDTGMPYAIFLNCEIRYAQKILREIWV